MTITKIVGFAINQNVDAVLNSANGFLLLGTMGAGEIRKMSSPLNGSERKEYDDILNSIKPEIKMWYNRVYKKNNWNLSCAQLDCLRLLFCKKKNRLNEYRRGTAVLQKNWKKCNKKVIIHTIAMSYDLSMHKSKRKESSKHLLEKALTSAFNIALENNFKSIAVPIMVARKNYGLNPKESESIILNLLKNYSFKEVILCYDNESTRSYLKMSAKNMMLNIFHLNKQKPKIIGICGRSCSGKSRIAKKIAEKYPDDVLIINSDKFFKIFNDPKSNKTDGWESPNSIRFDRIIYSVKKLKAGNTTHIPSHRRTEDFDKLIYPKKIVIVEGYLIFTNKELTGLFDLKLFVDISDINILYRRLLREGKIDDIDYIMQKVILISKKYDQIQKDVADIIIDGNKPKDKVLKDAEQYLKNYIIIK